MRTILYIFLFLALTSFKVEPEPLKLTWHLIVALIAGLYEVIIRLIPTVANYSAIHKIIEILVWLSNFLNRKKKRPQRRRFKT